MFCLRSHQTVKMLMRASISFEMEILGTISDIRKPLGTNSTEFDGVVGAASRWCYECPVVQGRTPPTPHHKTARRPHAMRNADIAHPASQTHAHDGDASARLFHNARVSPGARPRQRRHRASRVPSRTDESAKWV
jgi:hypothetical protein